MKDTLLNTFNPFLTLIICSLLIMGSMTWTNKSTTKPLIPVNPSLKKNSFM